MSSVSYAYYNGAIAPADNLGVPLDDLGILRGYAVFDFLRTYGGKLFLLREHSDRFIRSARMLGMRMPVSRATLERVVHELIGKNGFTDSTVRMVLTGGPSVDGLTLGKTPTLYILVMPLHEPPASRYTRGVGLTTYEYQRLLPEAKTSNYILAIKEQPALKRQRAIELLFVSSGKVLECNSSNIFIVRGPKIITPRNNILIGTTRNFLIQTIEKEYSIIERNVTTTELRRADEVFITASNKGVMPVTRIDGKPIGEGIVGPHTKRIMTLYAEAVKNYG